MVDVDVLGHYLTLPYILLHSFTRFVIAQVHVRDKVQQNLLYVAMWVKSHDRDVVFGYDVICTFNGTLLWWYTIRQ